MPRIGSLVVYIDENIIGGTCWKILKKTYIKDKGEVCLVKLNITGQNGSYQAHSFVWQKKEKKKDPKIKHIG